MGPPILSLDPWAYFRKETALQVSVEGRVCTSPVLSSREWEMHLHLSVTIKLVTWMSFQSLGVLLLPPKLPALLFNSKFETVKLPCFRQRH